MVFSFRECLAISVTAAERVWKTLAVGGSHHRRDSANQRSSSSSNYQRDETRRAGGIVQLVDLVDTVRGLRRDDSSMWGVDTPTYIASVVFFGLVDLIDFDPWTCLHKWYMYTYHKGILNLVL